MNFRLRYAFLFPGVNSRAELVPSPRANAPNGASRRWLGDKGRRSRTPPVYSLFKFQSKFMFCIKMKDCLLITVFQNIDELYM